jgi:hypothetical protein
MQLREKCLTILQHLLLLAAEQDGKMSSIWRLLKRKASRRKPTPRRSIDGADNDPSITTPSTNRQHVDRDWEPLTKEDILANLRVEYEDAEEETIEPEMLRVTETQVITESTSKTWIPYSTSIPIDDNDHEITNLEAGSDSVKRSYMAIVPTTIQMLDARSTLFVWHANFHPAIGRRFSSVLISVKFTPAPMNTQLPTRSKAMQTARGAHPSVIAYAPHKSFGATSSEQRQISWGLELPVSVPAGPVSVGVTPSGQSETKKEVQHAFTIAGSSRGSTARHTCVWTIEENGSTERGIPSELQLAALVQYSGAMVMEVDITGRTAGGYLPSHDLRPKTTAMGRKKIVDPTKFKDLLFEFELEGGDKLESCKRLLDRWTGKVEGAVLEFDQPLVRA